MTDDPTTTTPPPSGQPQALTDVLPGDTEDYSAWVERLEPIARQRVGWLNDAIDELRDRLRAAEAERDEARSEIMRLQDNDSAYDVGYQRADAAAGAAIDRLRQECDEARARAAHFETLAKDQQRLNEAMVASLQRGLAQLEASEAEVARLRDDCAALLKILDATYDGSLGRFTRDRISEEINAALDVTGKGGAPADQARREGPDDGK